MAAAHETATDFETQFQSKSVCSICDKSFTDPRILPCFHTFCFKCIKEEVRGEAHQNEISCPVCQSPAKTKVAAICKNAYIARLILTAKAFGLSQTPFLSDSVYRNDDYGCSRTNTAHGPKDNKTRSRKPTTSKVSPEGKSQNNGSDLAQLQRRRKCPKHSGQLLKLYCIDCNQSMCYICCMKHLRHSQMNIATNIDELRTMTNSYSIGVDACQVCNTQYKLLETVREVGLKTMGRTNSSSRSVSQIGYKSSRPKPANPQSPSLSSTRDRISQISLDWKKLKQQFYEEVTTKGFHSDICKTATDLCRLRTNWCHLQEVSDRQSQKEMSPQTWVNESESERNSSRQLVEKNQIIRKLLAEREILIQNEADLMENLKDQHLKCIDLNMERDYRFAHVQQMQGNRRDTANGTYARPQHLAHRESRPNENEAKLVFENEEQWMRELGQLIFWVENIDPESVEFQIMTERESEKRMIKELKATISKKIKELVAKEKHFVNKIAELNQKINEQQSNAAVQEKLEEALRKERRLNAEVANLKQRLEQCRNDKKQRIDDKQREIENLLQWIDRTDKQSANNQTTIKEESGNNAIEKVKASIMKMKNESRAREKQLLKKITEVTELVQSLINTNDADQRRMLLENEQLLQTNENQSDKIHELERQAGQLQDDLTQKHQSNKILREKLRTATAQQNRIEESDLRIIELQLKLQTERQTNQELLRNKERMHEELAEKERLWRTEHKDKIREMESHILQLQEMIKQRIDSDKKLELGVTRDAPLFADVTNVKHPLTLNRKKTCNDSSAVQIAACRPPNLTAPRGLKNLGNTCYFGAALQNLYQTVLLTDELFYSIYEQPSQNINLECDRSLTVTYLEFLNEGYEDRSKERLRQLIKKFFEKSPRFGDRRQHDSHDLLIHFLNCLRDDERRRCGSSNSSAFRNVLTAVDKVFGGHAITVYVCYACSTPYHVCEPFLDLSVPIVGPKDGTEEEKEEEDMFMNGHSADTERQLTAYGIKKNDSRIRAVKATMRPLRVRPQSKAQEKLCNKRSPNAESLGRISLKQCVAYFSRIEQIRNEYLCYQCQATGQQPMTSASKRTLIYNPPAVLVLHLKRFEQTVSGFKKCNQRVTYDEYLDIGPYCSSSCLRLIEPDDASIWYSLYGVVVHMGSLTAGHYVSYIKIRDYDTRQAKKFLQQTFLNRDQVLNDDDIRRINASEGMHGSRKEWKPTEVDGRWFLVDDEDVRVVDKAEALSQEAYILFYERVAKPNDTVV